MKKIALKVTSAFLVDGKIAKVGDVVEVGESDAKSLLHRGKAVLATVKPAESDEQREAREAAEAEAAAKAAADVTLTNDGKTDADGTLTDEGTSAEPQAEAAQPEAEQPEAAPKAKGKKAK